MGKKVLGAALVVWLVASSGGYSLAAFPADEVMILEQNEIVALPDDKLIDTYIDVLAEMEASKTFHATSGFTPKEYKKYKDLVRYRLKLMFELHRRKLELPPSIN
ncbi:MAG: hypothetical protein HGA80_04185 [Candidatus Omnitrophica bacterium]|nr:hypothetical protein [Candidatus Omnitrophota bacterium]